MKTIANVIRVTAALSVLAALLVGGCAREELAGPSPAVPAVTEIGLDGSATLELGDVLVSSRLGQVRYLDAAGNLVEEVNPGTMSGQAKQNRVEFAGYLNGVDLELTQAGGGLRRFLHVSEPLAIPTGATFVEFVDYLQIPAGLSVRTVNGTLQPGEEELTGSSFVLADDAREALFHVPAPIAWDANGVNRPWMMYRLSLDETGELEVGTQLLTAWVSNPGAAYPLTIDPTVTPGAPAPFVASAFLAPTAPYSSTVSLAATYSNAYNDSLEVVIDWGDGTVSTRVTNLQLQELHTFAEGSDEVTVTVQLSDFSVDENGDPAPRTVREELSISLSASTDDGIPGGDDGGDGDGDGEVEACGFEHIDRSDLDWYDTDDDNNFAREEDEDRGEPLGFDFVLDGRTYTHFNVCSNGWVQLLDGDTDAYDRSRRDDIDDWMGDYVDDADGGAVVFAAMDNWDPDYRDGYFGFLKGEDRVTFFWRSATWRDGDNHEGTSSICEFSVVMTDAGLIHINFSDDNHDRESYELFTGLYLPSAGNWEEGTMVEMGSEEFPDNDCFTYPGDFATWPWD